MPERQVSYETNILDETNDVPTQSNLSILRRMQLRNPASDQHTPGHERTGHEA